MEIAYIICTYKLSCYRFMMSFDVQIENMYMDELGKVYFSKKPIHFDINWKHVYGWAWESIGSHRNQFILTSNHYHVNNNKNWTENHSDLFIHQPEELSKH